MLLSVLRFQHFTLRLLSILRLLRPHRHPSHLFLVSAPHVILGYSLILPIWLQELSRLFTKHIRISCTLFYIGNIFVFYSWWVWGSSISLIYVTFSSGGIIADRIGKFSGIALGLALWMVGTSGLSALSWSSLQDWTYLPYLIFPSLGKSLDSLPPLSLDLYLTCWLQ